MRRWQAEQLIVAILSSAALTALLVSAYWWRTGT